MTTPARRKPLSLRKSTIRCASLWAPFAAFSLPLGLDNAIISALAMTLAIPLVFHSISKRILWLLPLMVLLVVTTVAGLYGDGASWFQFVRTGVPFILVSILICNLARLRRVFEEAPASARAVNALVWLLIAGQVVQVALFYVGFDVANKTLVSLPSDQGDAGRIFLFPLLASLLVFFHLMKEEKYFMVAAMSAVLLATGSKSVLLTMIALASLALLHRPSFTSLPVRVLVCCLAVSLMLVANLTALDRLKTFVTESQWVDDTRTAQIEDVRQRLLGQPIHLAAGFGFVAPVKPPIPTSDPRWYENSQFDIENGYWMLLAKVGVLGSLMLLASLLLIERNVYTLAAAIAAAINLLGSGAALFNVDGVYLLLWLSALQGAGRGAARVGGQGTT